jgi:hypothetical protein
MSSTTVSVREYRHHKGSGQAFVQVNGHRHYLGKWDSPKSKERYAAFVAELAVRPVNLTPLVTSANARITVTELCVAYWEFAQRYEARNGLSKRTGCGWSFDSWGGRADGLGSRLLRQRVRCSNLSTLSRTFRHQIASFNDRFPTRSSRSRLLGLC